MIWNTYSQLEGSHAFLSPSKHYWLNYTPEKLIVTYENYKKVAMGTKYHSVAADLISLAIRLPNTAASFNSFVNDAIGFKMQSEAVLYYSPNAYGTADAISFEKGVLRIHDLKTGATPGSMNQLLIYAGLFCLNYPLEAREMNDICLRIYQNGEVEEFAPSVEAVFDVASKIVESDKIIESINSNGIL